MNEPKKTSTKPSATIKVKKKKKKTTKQTLSNQILYFSHTNCKNAVTKIYENNIFINDK